MRVVLTNCVMGLSLILFLSFPYDSFASKNTGRGKAVFKLCSSCHGVQARGNKTLLAPSIAGLPVWYLTKQLNNFRQGVRGQKFKDVAGIRMRSMARTLSDADVQAVSEYISGLPRLKSAATLVGNVDAGKALYATCLACHGPEGKGNEAMGAPPFVGMNDWYMMIQIKNFKAGLRGADAGKDPQGAMMAPMAQTLVDDQAIKNILSYIQTL